MTLGVLVHDVPFTGRAFTLSAGEGALHRFEPLVIMTFQSLQGEKEGMAKAAM